MTEGRGQWRELAADLGFRRLEDVHLTVGRGRAVAEITGVVHRYPRTVRVPLRVANRLVAAGAPLRITHLD